MIDTNLISKPWDHAMHFSYLLNEFRTQNLLFKFENKLKLKIYVNAF